MRSTRCRLLLVAALLTLTVGAGVGPLPAIAQTTVRPFVPRSSWGTGMWGPAFPVLDGLSTWLATFADPVAGAGQSPPHYAYFLDFTITDSFFLAGGRISLDVVGDQKFATLAVDDTGPGGGQRHQVQVPFPWKGNSFYFLWANRLADGVWGGWVYDNTAATWTYIGNVPGLATSGPAARMAQYAQTGVAWTGPDLATCAAYPQAVAVNLSPFGFVGSTPVETVLNGRADQAYDPSASGDCPSTSGFFSFPHWDYYVTGSAPPVAAPA